VTDNLVALSLRDNAQRISPRRPTL